MGETFQFYLALYTTPAGWAYLIVWGSIVWYSILEDIIYYCCSYCPFYYQAVFIYGSGILLYRLTRNDSTVFSDNFLIWTFLTNIRRMRYYGAYNLISDYCRSTLNKLSLYVRYRLMYMHKIYIEIFKSDWNKKNKQHLWRPTFKRYSYFGIFSYIRSKWHKNKK